MERKHNPFLTPQARELRKQMTPQEKQLWYDFLRTYPVRVLRQKVIDNFIVDFYCHRAKLAIEIDGAQHYTEAGKMHDEERTQMLAARGISVLRFSNSKVESEFKSVCCQIDDAIKLRIPLSTSLTSPFRQGGHRRLRK